MSIKQKSKGKSSQNIIDILAQSQELTPKQIVFELDKDIVGQDDAKRAVAIALRNRYRRKLVDPELREEIMPKNILMSGPTGVGKTEIARRLAKLANAPFVKVEATKFTEVGYVGRDIDSIIRDLLDVAVKNVRILQRKIVSLKAKEFAKRRILNILLGDNSSKETKDKFAKMLESGELDNKEIELDILDSNNSMSASFDIPGAQIGMINISDMIGKAMGSEKRKKSRMKVADAMKNLIAEESDKMIDEDRLIKDAISAVENDGIVFIDEIDKICTKSNFRGGEVSREGVQRDLLPLVEGTTINTKYGLVKTDHILFIASGAFHVAKPSDLLPELQGRFPIRVKLKPLSENDLVKILSEPKSSLVKQYSALIKVENIKLEFTKDGILEIARLAHKVNNEIENIGARRLHTMLEKILEDLSFNASEMDNNISIKINKKYVDKYVEDIVSSKSDLSKFIL